MGCITNWMRAHEHRLAVIVAWAVIAVGLGVFAPKLEHALSGAMWEVRDSEVAGPRGLSVIFLGHLSLTETLHPDHTVFVVR